MNIECFLEIEKKYDLYHKEVGGLHYWNYQRFTLWNYGICADTLGLDSYKVNPATSIGSIIKQLRFCLPRKSKKDVDIAFIGHPRRVKNGKYYECPYTEKLSEHFENCATIEEPYERTHFLPVKTKNLIYTDCIDIMSSVYLKFVETFRHSLYAEYYNTIREQLQPALDEMKENFSWNQSDDNLFHQMTTMVIKYRYMKKRYRRLLVKLKPKLIVEVVHYSFGRMLINEIAKELEIPAIELQHGTIYEEHIAYQYATDSEIMQFPDEIFLFSDFWKHRMRAPIAEKYLISTGYPTFDTMVRTYKKKKKVGGKYTILFVSQATIGIQLSELASELSCILPPEQYRLIFKLHPSEYVNWRKHYQNLDESKIEVASDSGISIYELFGESDMQIGVYSTALYEGLGFDLETLILKVGHYEAMNDVVSAGYAQFVESAEDVVIRLRHLEKKKKYTAESFWKENALENMVEEIEKIIK